MDDGYVDIDSYYEQQFEINEPWIEELFNDYECIADEEELE